MGLIQKSQGHESSVMEANNTCTDRMATLTDKLGILIDEFKHLTAATSEDKIVNKSIAGKSNTLKKEAKIHPEMDRKLEKILKMVEKQNQELQEFTKKVNDFMIGINRESNNNSERFSRKSFWMAQSQPGVKAIDVIQILQKR